MLSNPSSKAHAVHIRNVHVDNRKIEAALCLTDREGLQWRSRRVGQHAPLAGLQDEDLTVRLVIVHDQNALPRECGLVTDEVSTLVLRDNVEQSLAVSLDEIRSADSIADFTAFIAHLERDRLLDRAAEVIPGADELAERARDKVGLTRPTHCVLLAYAKLRTHGDLLASDLPDEPEAEEYLVSYFPGRAVEAVGLETVRGHRLVVDYLPKKQAREIYRFAQEKEELALEEGRQRHLEEKRAGAGGTTVAVNNAPLPTAAALSDPVAKLTQLKQMLDASLITQADYDATKANILAAM